MPNDLNSGTASGSVPDAVLSPSQIPFLLRLLDDSSPRVRERVTLQLKRFGPDLAHVVAQAQREGAHITSAQHVLLDDILRDLEREASAEASWLFWLDESDPHKRLEMALDSLAQWQHEQDNEEGSYTRGSLSLLLDDLAHEFLNTKREVEAEEVLAWLFEEKGLRGDSEDYYSPRNSSLVHVIERGRGIPISLACVFVLVGRRLGLEVDGCAFPGHFLAAARERGHVSLFDCFNGSRLSPPEERAVRRAGSHLLASPPSPEDIVERTLNNLIAAYSHHDDTERARSARDLLLELRHVTRPEERRL